MSSGHLQQFIAALVKADLKLEPLRQRLYSGCGLEELLGSLSKSQSKYLTSTDITDFLSFNDPSSDHLALLVIKSYDFDRDGKLTFKEFVEMLRPSQTKLSARLHDLQMKDLVRQLLLGELALQESCEAIRKTVEYDESFLLNRAFDAVTKGRSAYITKEHLASAFSLSPLETEAALRRLDRDRDGKLSFKELEWALNPTAQKIKQQPSPESILKSPSPTKPKRAKRPNSVHFDEVQFPPQTKKSPFPRELNSKPHVAQTGSVTSSLASSRLGTLTRIMKRPEAFLSNGSSSTQGDYPNLPEPGSSSAQLVRLPVVPSKLSVSGEKLSPITATRAGLSGYNPKIDALVKSIVSAFSELEKLKVSALSNPNFSFAAAFSAFEQRNKSSVSVLDLLKVCSHNEVEISLSEAEALIGHLTSNLGVNLYIQHFKALLSSVCQTTQRFRSKPGSSLDSSLSAVLCQIMKLHAQLVQSASTLRDSLKSFKRFSLTNCYAGVSGLISKGSFMKMMSWLAVFSNTDARVRVARSCRSVR
jgi:Ca2+-binding EF-hand superfamily protein